MIKSGVTGEMIEARVGDNVNWIQSTGEIVRIYETEYYEGLAVDIKAPDGFILTHCNPFSCTLISRPFMDGDPIQMKIKGAYANFHYDGGGELPPEAETRHLNPSWRNAEVTK